MNLRRPFAPYLLSCFVLTGCSAGSKKTVAADEFVRVEMTPEVRAHLTAASSLCYVNRGSEAQFETWASWLSVAKNDPSLSKQIVSFLRDPYDNPKLVPIALYSLTRVGEPRDARAARVHLWDDDPTVRTCAIGVIREFADADSLVSLLRLAVHDSDVNVRAAACAAIPELRSFESWKHFDQTMDVSSHASVKNGRGIVKTILLQQAVSDPDPLVRDVALDSAGKI
jgi:hypothetical protein